MLDDLDLDRDGNGLGGTAPRTPKWVKVSAAVAALVVTVFALLHVTGDHFGRHGVPSSKIAAP